MTKSLTIALTLSIIILIAACGGTQEDAKETSGEVDSEIKSGEEVVVSDEELQSELTDEDYQAIREVFTDFELPEEPRLTAEEAEEYFHEDVKISDDNIYYASTFAFDKETKTAISTRWDKFEGLKQNDWSTAFAPRDGEMLGTFKKDIEDVFIPFLNNGYNFQGRESDYYEDVDVGGSWDIMKVSTSEIKYRIDRLQPFIDEEYNELQKWADETKTFFEKADTFDKEQWGEAYKFVEAGTKNLEKFVHAVEEAEDQFVENDEVTADFIDYSKYDDENISEYSERKEDDTTIKELTLKDDIEIKHVVMSASDTDDYQIHTNIKGPEKEGLIGDYTFIMQNAIQDKYDTGFDFEAIYRSVEDVLSSEYYFNDHIHMRMANYNGEGGSNMKDIEININQNLQNRKAYEFGGVTELKNQGVEERLAP